MPSAPDLHTTPAHVDEGVSTLVHRAVADARELAQAEIALVKAKANERIGAFASAAIFFGAAAVLALSAVTALLVGLILSLATLIGPLGATGVVVVVTLLIAAVLAFVGKGKLAPAKGLT
ncbi:phage holin family protein [Sphingomonas sp.]|uniref:phage holin family protein n=1 Tax=Sphingomonas sp. TaxID=28214 RepID=UPI003CC564EC